MPPFWVICSVVLFLSELRIFGEMDFVIEFSEFYENIILVIKKLSAGNYGKWARRENAGISAFKLLLCLAPAVQGCKPPFHNTLKPSNREE